MLLALVLAATIDCTGVWSPQTSEQALAAQFGTANVKRGQVYVGEGEEEEGTLLFPDDPKRRVEIVWKNKKARQSPEWLRVSDESAWNVFGLRTGMTLAEVEKRNGRPFRLYGFEWDFGGIVTNWREGAIAKLGGRNCRVGMELEYEYSDDAPEDVREAMSAVAGDQEISSTLPPLKKLKVRVRELTVLYP